MGSIKSAQLALGYIAPAPADTPRCQDCRHLTAAADSRGMRQPYCHMGGFHTWRDAGCVAGFAPRREADHG